MRLSFRKPFAAAAAAAALAATFVSPAWADVVLKVVPHADLKILDPVWTTAFVTRHHGYMIYDTLFGLTQKGEIKPQLVDSWNASPDNLHFSFTLREGLKFSDGSDLTTMDVLQSIRRWGARDNLGAKLLAALDKMEAKDARTFTLDFKTPFGMVLDAFSKPSSIPLFIMPERVAKTDPFTQITDMTGSGPYAFAADRYRPGERVVYLKNKFYKPRNEPADGLAGGKVVNVDELDWVILRDSQTVANAIKKGEVDVVEMVPNEQYPILKADPNIRLENQTGKQSAMLHLNHAIAPFNNPKAAQAALMAINQAALQRAQIVYKELYNTCTSIYPCGSTYASGNTAYFTGKPQFAKAKELLKEAGYKGEPIVLMLPADMPSLNKYPPVMAELLRRAGFTVDLQSMDWASLVTRRTKSSPTSEGGWNAFITFWNQADTFNPLFFAPLTGNGLKGWFGWTTDPELEKLKDDFVKTSDPAERKKIAEGIQLRVMLSGVYGMLGEAKPMVALRSNISGLVPAPVSVFWGLSKN
ncbi:ABC transporter substrate-binding protein [uncultured Sutterella sp.]|uniref:ABC transporter substrate-binding protein n=1 Tax=uncultured Sutterella sp. TaxID=286133 RepID=UPI0025EE5D1B|nr:ABC transporter substrate-binding protein [uncultured Sutterella sp.]